MLYVREAKGTVAEVVERLQQATTDNKFGIIETIDLRAKMAEKGVEFDRECVILEVCNPRQAKKVLEGDMAVSTVLPCRISVYEQGGKVRVATLKPTGLVSLFEESVSLQGVAREVEEAILRIIEEACE